MKINQLYDPFSGQLFEGMMFSTPVKKVESILAKSYRDLVYMSDVPPGSNKINITIKMSDNIDFKSIALSRYIDTNYSQGTDKISKLLQLMNNFGYFPSFIWYSNNTTGKNGSKKFSGRILRDLIEDYEYITIRFEPKFDDKINISKYSEIFHVTDKKYLDSITKKGLVPKTKSKIADHPDRIYFMPSKEDAIKISKDFRLNIKDLLILKIDTKSLPKDIIFYKDPNSEGFYTYDNIPKNLIQIEN